MLDALVRETIAGGIFLPFIHNRLTVGKVGNGDLLLVAHMLLCGTNVGY